MSEPVDASDQLLGRYCRQWLHTLEEVEVACTEDPTEQMTLFEKNMLRDLRQLLPSRTSS